MDFLTLHEFSLQFAIPVRVLRYRLRQLLQAGKLVDGEDYRRDDYVDETHFVWKINSISFARLIGIRSVNNAATQAPSSATQVVSEPLPLVTHPSPVGIPTLPNLDTKTLPNVDTRSPSVEREVIDLLKEQVRVKDGQIADLTAQSKTLTALHEKLTGAVVHQGEEIRNLLRLTGGKTEADEVVHNVHNHDAAAGSNSGSDAVADGNPTDANPRPVANHGWRSNGGERSAA